MPVTLAACLLLLLQASPAPSARAKAEEQVKAAVIGANLAYAKNDLPVYWTFYAPDLTQWWPTGGVDLPTYKKQWEKFIKDGGRIEQADVQDLAIQLGPSNDSAVASYRLTVTTKDTRRQGHDRGHAGDGRALQAPGRLEGRAPPLFARAREEGMMPRHPVIRRITRSAGSWGQWLTDGDCSSVRTG